jgi:hypothetical protein
MLKGVDSTDKIGVSHCGRLILKQTSTPGNTLKNDSPGRQARAPILNQLDRLMQVDTQPAGDHLRVLPFVTSPEKNMPSVAHHLESV